MGLTEFRWLLFSLALDFCQNALAIMMALRILRVRIRLHFVCFAAFFGALAAFTAGIAGLSRRMRVLLWLPVALGMMRAAAGRPGGIRQALGRAAALLACEGFLGGVVLALYGATGSLAAAHALSAAVSGAVFVSAWRAGRAAGDVRRVRVICLVSGRKLDFDAIIDSGNSLRDYLTHRPVIVAGWPVYEQLGRAGVRSRPIFADTAGGRQMMQLVIPTQTTLILERGETEAEAALAFSPALCGDVPALVPASLLEQRG